VRGKVLIVEDEVLISWSLKILLSREGYTVLGPVTNGPDALDALEDAPDVVLMDIQIMGPVDGVELARAIGERSTAKIIFTTGYSDPLMKERARSVDPHAILHKPIVPHDLLTELSLCLAR
jgi:CheY-like chemotaxis protein